nr:hypothetical protein [Desulfobulbaceae bacterium]
MEGVDSLSPKGDKLKKTLRWITEMVITHPEMERREIIEKAQIRYNLSPKECAFLNDNFIKPHSAND